MLGALGSISSSIGSVPAGSSSEPKRGEPIETVLPGLAQLMGEVGPGLSLVKKLARFSDDSTAATGL
eukprot:scaffold114583_cov27-Prasinocladus_malaysianus.AAC.3